MLAQRPPRWSRIGLAGVLVAFVGLGALYAFTVPKFLPADETSHVGYGLEVGHGHLPRLDTAVPDEVPGMALQYEVRRQIYTANHPPLYYVAVAAPLRLGVATGHPVIGFDLARLLTVALTATSAVAVWWTARLLSPARGDVALLAASVVLLLPAVARFGGVVYNDGFALAVSAWAIAVTVRLLVLGPTWRRYIVVLAAGAALTLTRAVGIPASGLVAVAAAGAVVLHGTQPIRRRLLPAVGAAAGIGFAAFVASGWFWLRSRRLYGDIAGSAYNLDRFGYGPRGTTTEMLRDPHWPVTLYGQLWGRIYDSADYARGWGALPGLLLLALVVAGIVALLVGYARRRTGSPVGEVRGLGPEGRGRLGGWLLLLTWSALIYVSTMGYIAEGGGIHGRYLFPGLPAAALLCAATIGGLPGRRHAVAPVSVIVVMAVTGLVWAARFADLVDPDARWWVTAMTATARASNAIPAPLVLLAIAMTAAGTAVTCRALIAEAPAAPT